MGVCVSVTVSPTLGLTNSGASSKVRHKALVYHTDERMVILIYITFNSDWYLSLP